MSGHSKRVRLLYQSSLKWYLCSCFFTNFGNGFTYIAIAWLVTWAQHGIAHMALLMMLYWAPTVFISPIIGVLVDRYNRKKLLITFQILQAAAMIVTWLILNYNSHIVSIYIMTFINSIIYSFYLPTSMTFVREIVSREDLLPANANIDAAYEVGNITGMGSAGVIISFTTIPLAFILNAFTFLVSMLFMLLIKHDNSHTPSKSSRERFFLYHDLKSGIAYLAKSTHLNLVYTIQMFILVCFMTAPIFLAPFAKHILHTSMSQFGEIEASLSLGVVLGSLFCSYFVKIFGFIKIIFLECLIIAVNFYLLKNTHSLISAKLIYFIIGLCYSVWPIIISKAQELTDLKYQGRTQSAYDLISGIFIILLYAAIYFLSNKIQIQQFYWFEIIIMSLAALMLLIYKYSKKPNVINTETKINIDGYGKDISYLMLPDKKGPP